MNYSRCKLTLAITFGFILFLGFGYLAVFGRALSQKENHIGIMLVLPRVILNSKAVRVDDKTYLTKNAASFINEMEQQGFNHIEQLGAGHFFKKNEDIYVSTSRMYSSHFMVFTKPVKN